MQYNIGMSPKFLSNIVPHRIKDNFNTFASSKFKSGNKISIARDNYNSTDGLFEGKSRHIEADPHINPLLR